MSSRHCLIGKEFFSAYKTRALELVAAYRTKKLVIRSASRNEWNEIAGCVDNAIRELGKARHAYIEHIIGCDSCKRSGNIAEYLDSSTTLV
jgi:hypothetical protein